MSILIQCNLSSETIYMVDYLFCETTFMVDYLFCETIFMVNYLFCETTFMVDYFFCETTFIMDYFLWDHFYNGLCLVRPLLWWTFSFVRSLIVDYLFFEITFMVDYPFCETTLKCHNSTLSIKIKPLLRDHLFLN